MKVPTVTRGGATDSARRKKATGGHGAEFAETLRETAMRGAGDVIQTSATQAVGAVLLAQEADDSTEGGGRGSARRHADHLLDRLEELRFALLSGSIGQDRIAAIAQALRGRRAESDDPELNAIIEEIELRAEVELAKLTHDD